MKKLSIVTFGGISSLLFIVCFCWYYFSVNSHQRIDADIQNQSTSKNLICSHPKIYKLVQMMLEYDYKTTSPEYKKQYSVTLAPKIQGDPHHFTPTPGEIKELIAADFLLLPPSKLAPWGPKVAQLWQNFHHHENQQRKRPTDLILDVTEKTPGVKFYLSSYKDESEINKMLGALNHFWIYPEISCHLARKIYAQLYEEGLVQNPSFPEKFSLCSSERIQGFHSRLKVLGQKLSNTLIVLGHNALSPLLKSYNIPHVSLKGSHHHDEVSLSSLKKIHQVLLSYQNVNWIFEKHVQIPLSVKDHYIKKNHQILKIDLEGITKKSSPLSYFHELEEFLSFLEKSTDSAP